MLAKFSKKLESLSMPSAYEKELLEKMERTLDNLIENALDRYKRNAFQDKYPEAELTLDGVFDEEWETLYLLSR